MKTRQFKLQTPLYFLVLALFLLSSCIEGPRGPAGEDGEDGKDGVDGIDGKDGTAILIDSTMLINAAQCMACHNDTTLLKSKIIQWDESGHATGGNFERSTKSCAGCHTSEGFRERLASGADTLVGDILDPTPQNCRTCHMIHENFDSTDFDLRVPPGGEVVINLTGESFDFGKGNLCASCHQPRTSYPIPDLANDSTEITSGRFGPHHGAQATTLAGDAGFEIAGSLEYENSDHWAELENGCVDCHMAKAYGDAAGGHNLSLSYEYHGSERQLLTGCVACHDDNLEDFNYQNVSTITDSLLLVLGEKLTELGILDTTGMAVKGTYSTEIAGALWNYKTVLEDGSGGNHNFPYTQALLVNSIEALE